MKLTKDFYKISRETIEKCLKAIGNNWFSGDGTYNNDDIIEVDQVLRKEVEDQEKL